MVSLINDFGFCWNDVMDEKNVMIFVGLWVGNIIKEKFGVFLAN